MKAMLLALICCFVSPLAQGSCVILLHGLARSATSMNEMAEKLTDAGYHTVNLGYPSREFSIETLTEKAIQPALAHCNTDEEINFVTHSLGGILVRQYLANHTIENLNRVVMLGPPNQGSEVVDKLRDVPGFHWLNGDAGLQLGTDAGSIPMQLGPADFDVGIIAGDKSINWILSLLIPGDDDGKVSIERSKLPGMNDHIVMPTTHPLMMNNNAVINQVIHYLRDGAFSRD